MCFISWFSSRYLEKIPLISIGKKTNHQGWQFPMLNPQEELHEKNIIDEETGTLIKLWRWPTMISVAIAMLICILTGYTAWKVYFDHMKGALLCRCHFSEGKFERNCTCILTGFVFFLDIFQSSLTGNFVDISWSWKLMNCFFGGHHGYSVGY